MADNTRIITRNGRGIIVNALRGKRLRLDGKFAITGGMTIDGNLEMREGCALRLPADPEKAFAKSISIRGGGSVTLKPGVQPRRYRFQKLMRLEELPKDCSHFRLNPSDGPEDAAFKSAPGGESLGVTPRK